MRILIADDEVEVGRVFKTLLRSQIPNSSIDAVVNGAEAVDAFRNGGYDVVLLDVRMPVKDGYHACREIQELCRRDKLKIPFVIFYSGYGVTDEIEKLLADESHYAFINKPVTCEQLIATIRTIHEC